MSGDVQPRKRKDKRKKKEGTSLGSIHEPVASHKFRRSESDDLKIFDLPEQGEKIHVQNEHGVGGNICVKIIFFCLFGLLVGAVGLIYMKSQGSSDVDLPTIEESRFAEYFTGWLDDSIDAHEHEVVENNIDHEHDENDEHDEQEDHDNHDNEDDDEHENDEEDQQDPIYKLFGLQQDEADVVEENDIEEKEVTRSESGPRLDVDEDEEDEEEEEEDEEDEKNEVKDTEEEEDEDDAEEKNEIEDVGDDEDEDEEEEEEDKTKDTEEDEEEDNEMEEEEGGKDKDDDNDSGVDVEEHNVNENDEGDEEEENDDEDDDDNLSQMDEEDEDKYHISHVKSNKLENLIYKKERLIERDDDDDDDDEDEEDKEEEDENDEKDFIKEEQSDEDIENNKNYNKDELETDEVEKDNEDEEVTEKKPQKLDPDTDDLGFDEIDLSEEDLETEDDQKENENDNDEGIGHQFKERTKTSFANNKKDGLEIQPGIDDGEEETEADTGGVAIKLGVGIAMIIVAHLVLVKKWKSMNSVPSDENVSTESASEKNEIENLQSCVEPVISRRQTLVPENIFLSDEPEGEMEEEEERDEEEEEEQEEEEEDEEEEEQQVENDEYSEEEEFKKNDSWESFAKPSWNIKRDEKEEEDDVDNEEPDDEDEYEDEAVEDDEDGGLEEEEEVEEDDEDYEEEIDDDVEDDGDIVKQKSPTIVDKRQEEVKETAPTPPPRSRGGKGGHEVDEDSIDFEPFIQEVIRDDPKADDFANNNLEPEEQKTSEKKVGSEDEWAFRQEFDFAEEQFENNPKVAVETYDKIISKKPTMIRALIGRAKALDRWAEKEKSNAYLKQAINAYKTVLFSHGERLDDETYIKLSERCIERMRFAGNFVSAIDIHKALILKYPNDPKYRNALAVTYLMLNKIPQARVLLNETLSLWPENGFALAHYGFILKTSDNNMEEGAKKLMAGIKTREEGVIDGMFFFHLGDALNRLGREKEAMTWYELGVKEGLFLSKYQRSLYNVNRLKGQPWWTKEETTYQDFFRKLEDNWREIRREGLELLNSKGINLFKEEAENLKDTGDWKQLDLYFRGRKQANCNKAPITCSLVSSFKPASTCTRGQIKFSVMLPNTHVWPHCGPTNCRLRSHLGLVVPKKTFIRVAEETRSWEEGKFIIFDDSFEHEVWHNGTGLRLVLIVDVWHPELTNHERRYLSPI